MEKICGIYIIENIVNKHRYIGSSNNIDYRMQQHSYALDNGDHKNPHLQNAFNKYGFENFIWDVLIICDIDMLLFFEQRFMNAMHPEYNISNIAGKVEFTEDVRRKQSESHKGHSSWIGRRHSNETRMKMSESAKARTDERYISEEGCRKLSDIMKGNKYWLGRHHTSETKERLSVSTKAAQARFTPEQRSKNAKKSAETRRRNKGLL